MDESDYVLVNTVANNKTKYSPHDYSCTITAKKFHQTISRPSLKSHLDIVDNNCLLNCPVTREDIIAAENIFGLEVGFLKGKTVCHDGVPVRTLITMIPPSILEKYKTSH
eukprot:110690-Ditylum_brightwellii.AAC.1